MVAAVQAELPAGWRAIFRPRAYGAYRLDKLVGQFFARTKTAVDSENVAVAGGMGRRVLSDGTQVLSDWDLAAVLDGQGKLVPERIVNRLRGRINTRYGIDLIQHPDNVNGMLAGNERALRVWLGEDWIVIRSTGLEGSVNARVLLNRLEQIWGIKIPRQFTPR